MPRPRGSYNRGGDGEIDFIGNIISRKRPRGGQPEELEPRAPHELDVVRGLESVLTNPYVAALKSPDWDVCERFQNKLYQCNIQGRPMDQDDGAETVTQVWNLADEADKGLSKIASDLKKFMKQNGEVNSIEHRDGSSNPACQLAFSHATYVTTSPHAYMDLMGEEAWAARTADIHILVCRISAACSELKAFKSIIGRLKVTVESMLSNGPSPRIVRKARRGKPRRGPMAPPRNRPAEAQAPLESSPLPEPRRRSVDPSRDSPMGFHVPLRGSPQLDSLRFGHNNLSNAPRSNPRQSPFMQYNNGPLFASSPTSRATSVNRSVPAARVAPARSPSVDDDSFSPRRSVAANGPSNGAEPPIDVDEIKPKSEVIDLSDDDHIARIPTFRRRSASFAVKPRQASVVVNLVSDDEDEDDQDDHRETHGKDQTISFQNEGSRVVGMSPRQETVDGDDGAVAGDDAAVASDDGDEQDQDAPQDTPQDVLQKIHNYSATVEDADEDENMDTDG